MRFLNCCLTFILAKRILQLFALFSDTLGLVDCHEQCYTSSVTFLRLLWICLKYFLTLNKFRICNLTNFQNIFYSYISICPKNCISISCVCYYFYAQIIWSKPQSGTIYTTWHESEHFWLKWTIFVDLDEISTCLWENYYLSTTHNFYAVIY